MQLSGSNGFIQLVYFTFPPLFHHYFHILSDWESRKLWWQKVARMSELTELCVDYWAAELTFSATFVLLHHLITAVVVDCSLPIGVHCFAPPNCLRSSGEALVRIKVQEGIQHIHVHNYTWLGCARRFLALSFSFSHLSLYFPIRSFCLLFSNRSAFISSSNSLMRA